MEYDRITKESMKDKNMTLVKQYIMYIRSPEEHMEAHVRLKQQDVGYNTISNKKRVVY